MKMNKKLRKAILDLDLDTAKKFAHTNTALLSKEAQIAGLHKLRFEMKEATPGQKAESRAWLVKRGYKRIYGLPFDHDI